MTALILAVSALLHWTVLPGVPADRYEAERRFRDDTQFNAAHLWADSARTKDKLPPLAPVPTAVRDSGWAYVDNDSLQWMRYHIRQCAGASCSDWSNEVVLAYRPAHQECYFLQRTASDFTDPRVPKDAVLSFNLALDDSLGVWTIVTQTFAQRALRALICREFTDSLGAYWVLDGARRRDCP